MTDPIRPTDDEARALARSLLEQARHAALATLTETDTAAPAPDPTAAPMVPMVTRIALACDPEGQPLTLVSRLAGHTAPLLTGAPCSLLVGEPGARGDPLTHPRLTLQALPEPVLRGDPAFAALAAHYVAQRPKARLYVDFADFLLVRFRPVSALLNGGFGKAFRLSAADLVPTETGSDSAGQADPASQTG